MESFTAYFLIACYFSVLAVAVYFAIHTIKAGKIEPEKEIKITEEHGVNNAYNSTD